MKDLDRLLDNNKTWARHIKERNSGFFQSLSKPQSPGYLWIGCSDSRVPSANQLVNLMPGELFVHHNIANVVAHTDYNCLSVMQFAVDVLKVRHIIICGHYGCGGIEAASDNLRLGLLNNWLCHVQDVMHKHNAELDRIEDRTKRLNRLCELNVIEQVMSAASTPIVQNAWQREQPLAVHGLIYGLNDGLLRDLRVRITNQRELPAAYKEALLVSA
jgi:carbonic anhydrase